MTLFVVMLFTFLQSSDVTGEVSRGPDNQVAIVRASVTLECSSGIKGCSSVEWLKTESDNSTSIYRSYVGVSEQFRDRYRVDETDGCNLVIRNLTMSDAGVFVCRIANVDSLSASLIVLESIPSCERLRTKPSRSENKNDELVYRCTLTFAGFVDRATMVWLHSSNGTHVERVPPQQQTGGTISRSFLRSVDQLSENETLRCVTRFRVLAERFRASNVPEAKCETTDTWQSGTEDFTKTDLPPSNKAYSGETNTTAIYIVVGVAVLLLALLALFCCLGCAGVNCPQ